MIDHNLNIFGDSVMNMGNATIALVAAVSGFLVSTKIVAVMIMTSV